MKVLLVNGSPHEKGCTFTALSEAAGVFEENGIEAEIVWLGNKALSGCIACGTCRKTGGKCVFGDIVNTFAEKAKSADGFIFGTPVHYAAAGGAITSFMDRLFYSNGAAMRFKPAATVVSCRRGGASAAFDQLNKYYTINNMPVVSSNYWNQIHGSSAEQALRDEEGMQTVRVLAMNMSWLIRCIDCGSKNGIDAPQLPDKVYTNFIR